jgi:uncharacterized damage-inducible protein DinB
LVLLFLLLLIGPAIPGLAQDDGAEESTAETAPPAGYLGDFLADFDSASKKLLALAEAVPAEQYGFAVSEEVRNYGRVLVHVAGANFFLSRTLGVEPPEELTQDMEDTVTSKDDIIALLKKSQDHVRKAVELAATDDLEREIEVFGAKRSLRAVFLIIAGHSHEHLGQSIAYARGAGVVPPWSQGG